jgi:hypothetical protein
MYTCAFHRLSDIGVLVKQAHLTFTYFTVMDKGHTVCIIEGSDQRSPKLLNVRDLLFHK